jgi:hypothetical protein
MIGALPQIQPACLTSCSISQLTALAINGLRSMFDADRQLFCFRVKRSRGELVREGISHRYTIIALLGLHHWEGIGGRSPFDVNATLEVLLRNTTWITNLGDLGLLLWLCALASPERLGKLSAEFDLQGALDRYREAREGRTMELAWFLSGLSHQALADREKLADFADLAAKSFRLLKNNQGETGTFGHIDRKGSLAGVLRGRIGSFADQVYPVYALARFAQAYGSKEALTMASACAQGICRVQGPQGQWWWHYDSTTGKVAGKYPVYSVHQDGMAPMALVALSKVTGCNFAGPIDKGLQWITGSNELSRDLRDLSLHVIWRCAHPRHKYKMYLDDALGLVGVSVNRNCAELTVREECRPYEFGWLLYALSAGVSGRPVSQGEAAT